MTASFPQIWDSGELRIQQIDREIRFVGLKRSGNHAILNWIIRQGGRSILHFNNVRPDDPYQAWALTTCTTDDIEHVARAIYSIEDTTLAVVGDAKSYPQHPVYPDLRVGERLDVLLLRDPFNLVASRFRRGGAWGELSTYVSGMSLTQMWVTYALEFLQKTRWLSRDCVRVSYNQWCRSETYRRKLAERLGLTFTDEGFREVTSFGGGSSFERTEMDGSADLMRTDHRWRRFENDPSFVALFQDPLLLDLAEEIFEFDDRTASFISDTLRPRSNRRSALSRWWAMKVGQRLVARLRRSDLLRRIHARVTRKRRAERLPMKRPE